MGKQQATRGAPAARSTHSWRGRGFTLVELAIVIGILVLVLALAVPAFNVLSGQRSIEVAENQLSAVLSRARAEAIGVQEPRGLLFYIDPATQRIATAYVRAVPPQAGDTAEVALDLLADRESLLLPTGIALQTLHSSTGTVPDRYIGFNTLGSTPIGGVILFDAGGQLRSLTYGFRGSNIAVLTGADASTFVASASGSSMRSQIGVVLFEREPFESRPTFDWEDPGVGGGSLDADEIEEETWLDEHAAPLLVNRYNGTLMKGE